ncbi:MAG: hypothetical protein J6W54_03835 [Fibrobacter sp.]|uniref:hypothetical protein n=1 Tax=Fibrobacter sp. TaxID=35828 RepID=UPI001B09AE88|nr:hypothetical protein [Fibrobacter sp.]MBO7060212.1 hypothetical protein [Fibrobacter sp.]
MNRLYLVFFLSLLAVFAGCDSNQVDAPLDLSAEEDFSSSSFSSSDVSSSSDASSSSVSSSSYGGIGKPKTIHGFAQKGPLVDKAQVKVVFLDESTLDSMGKAYYGKIDGDYGEYSVQIDSVESRYVQVTISGKSSSKISVIAVANDIDLNAIADIGTLDSINLNLFTRLETGRVRELVRNQHLSFDEAKVRSRKEIADMFHISFTTKGGKPSDGTPPETWGFYTNEADDIFLMAGSYLLGWIPEGLAGPVFKKLLEDFAKEGKCLNDSAVYQMAKSCFYNELDTMVNGGVIDRSMAGSDIDPWRKKRDSTEIYLSGVVEKKINSIFNVFWEKELDLGECSLNYDTVKKSRYGDYFTCGFSGIMMSGEGVRIDVFDGYVGPRTRWMPARRKDRNTYGIKCEINDLFVTADNPDSISYLCKFRSWREALDIEEKVGVCDEEMERTFQESDKYGYICERKEWVVITDTLEDVRDGTRYAFRKAAGLFWILGDLRDTVFTWDEADQCPEGWRLPTSAEWGRLFEQFYTFLENASPLNITEDSGPWWSSTEQDEGHAVSASLVPWSTTADLPWPMSRVRIGYDLNSVGKDEVARVRCVKE